MSNRYTRIMDGPRLKTAFDNYVQYKNEAATRPRKIGTRPSYNYSPVYIYPFGLDLAAITNRLAFKAQSTHITTLSPLINDPSTGCQVDVDTSPANIQEIRNFKPAKVTWQRSTGKQKTTATSEVTKLEYLTYEGVQRFASPFGRSSETDNVYDCFVALKSLLKAQPFQINRVSLSEENITY